MVGVPKLPIEYDESPIATRTIGFQWTITSNDENNGACDALKTYCQGVPIPFPLSLLARAYGA